MTTADTARDLVMLLQAVAGRLGITKPLAVFDIESTGVNPEVDRIVEITIARIEPGTLEVSGNRFLVHPNMPIPKEASDIHGITDEMVKDKPFFGEFADRVFDLLAGADLVGYNHRRFDTRLVAAECARCAFKNPCEGARLIDVGLIFMKREPRTLTAAMQFFCGQAHEDAHGTTADVTATLRVLLSQFDRYEDLPRDVDALDAMGRDPSWIDKDGKLVFRNGEACIGFGKNQGRPLRELVKKDPGYLSWILQKDFPDDVKAIIRDAQRGTFPPAPAAAVQVEA